MLSVNITLCRNCVCMMMLTFSFNYTLLEQIVQSVYNDTHVEFDEDQRQQLFHCPVPSSTVYSQGHRFTKDLIQLVFFVVSCVDRVYVHVKPYIIRLLVRMVPLKILILSVIALKLMFNT